MKLSIIVPIYNVEQYLRKCVDSLLNQHIDDYEIILIDDGSPDTCPQICDEYAAAHGNIRVIHRENGGLSAARNSGLEVALGEYIMFMDSDDYIEPNVLSGLLSQIDRDNLEVLRYNYQNVNEQYEVFLPYRNAKRDVDYSETVVDGETFLNERLGQMCYAVMFIIKRELLKDCMFKEGIYFEDAEWTPRMLVSAKRVASTPKVVYNYLWRSGSITLPTDPIKREKVLRDKIALIRGFKEQSNMVKEPKWFTWMTSFTAMGILTSIARFSKSERNKYISELKQMHIFPLSVEKEKMLTHKFKIILANISPSFYYAIMSIRK